MLRTRDVINGNKLELQVLLEWTWGADRKTRCSGNVLYLGLAANYMGYICKKNEGVER